MNSLLDSSYSLETDSFVYTRLKIKLILVSHSWSITPSLRRQTADVTLSDVWTLVSLRKHIPKEFLSIVKYPSIVKGLPTPRDILRSPTVLTES